MLSVEILRRSSSDRLKMTARWYVRIGEEPSMVDRNSARPDGSQQAATCSMPRIRRLPRFSEAHYFLARIGFARKGTQWER
jgi:hypothetical protein